MRLVPLLLCTSLTGVTVGCGRGSPGSDGDDDGSESGGTGDEAACGDGALGPGEACDDANAVNHDGCDQDCQPSGVVALVGRACARLRLGEVRCWGPRVPGTAGEPIGDDEPAGAAPILDFGVEVSSVVRTRLTGYENEVGCAVMNDGTVQSWEYWSGVGMGAVEPVSLPAGVSAVFVDGARACALTEAGELHCWGTCFYGGAGPFGTSIGDCFGLGVGEFESVDQAAPAMIPLDVLAVDVALGIGHSCALSSEGDVRCWGGCPDPDVACNPEFELRSCLTGRCLGGGGVEYIGDDEPASAAAVVPIGGKAIEIGAVHFQTCALREDGRVVCWGQSLSGDLIIGDDEDPAVAGLVEADDLVQLGIEGTTARRDDGSIWQWSLLSLTGQPVDIGTIATDLANECALTVEGTVRCWGDNGEGWAGCGSANCPTDEDVPLFDPG